MKKTGVKKSRWIVPLNGQCPEIFFTLVLYRNDLKFVNIRGVSHILVYSPPGSLDSLVMNTLVSQPKLVHKKPAGAIYVHKVVKTSL